MTSDDRVHSDWCRSREGINYQCNCAASSSTSSNVVVTKDERLIPHPERVKAAAIQINGLTFSLPPPYRHHHIIERLSDLGLPWPIQGNQGFVSSEGVFMDRVQAAMCVGLYGAQLFSEDLW